MYTTGSTDVTNVFTLLFHLSSLPNELELTAVHGIVLGLSQLDLESEIQEHPDLINAVDVLGRTALWWSSRRDDVQSSALLLAYGADPNIANAAGRPPLHNVASQGNTAIVKLLLESDASVRQKSFEGKIPLQVVGAYADNGDIVKLMLDYGSDVNAQDAYGRTTLSLCCYNSTCGIAKILLEHGADLNIVDIDGWYPWHWAIRDGAAKALQLYLSYGCDLSPVLDKGWTVLHFAAYPADEPITRVLMEEADLSHVNADVLDKHGRTADDILSDRYRSEAPDYAIVTSTFELLQKLIRKVKSSNESITPETKVSFLGHTLSKIRTHDSDHKEGGDDGDLSPGGRSYHSPGDPLDFEYAVEHLEGEVT